MRSYRFEVGTGRGLTILNITAKEELSGRLKTNIMEHVAYACTCYWADAEDCIKWIASCHGEEINDIQVFEDMFNIIYIDDMLRETKSGKLLCDADEIYTIMATASDDNNRYFSLVGCRILEGDRRILRMAVQRTDISKSSHQFDFVFSNAYPEKSVQFPNLEHESKAVMAIPYMTNTWNLIPVLNELSDVSSVNGGVSRVAEILHRVGHPSCLNIGDSCWLAKYIDD